MRAIVKTHGALGLSNLALIGAFAIITGGTRAHAQTPTPMPTPTPTPMPMPASPPMPMDHSKMSGDKSMPGMKGDMGHMKGMGNMQMTGNPDMDFATMTRSHHAAGIEMAKAELANGKDPAMKKMAKKILDAQTKELADFDRWLAAHKAK